MPHGPLEVDLQLEHPIPLKVRFRADAVTALVGPNGSGKTTLLRALTGVLPSEGHIHCGGHAWQGAGSPMPTGERRIGFMPQRGGLFPHMNVRDNAAFGLLRRHRPADARERVQPLLESLGVAQLADRRARTLSGGETQRVALARALAVDPCLLLLDEPLDALDAVSHHEVRALLRDHLMGIGVPTVVVSHDVRDVAVLAQTVVVLEQGLIVQRGTLPALAAEPATPYVRAFLQR